ncbi:aspartyl protease family protein 2-like [Zingiber officinale]|uniref:aspartyl protease family protein 2-like n=1 Tax=Zingiber officinale TaxID=94328 RepID=UPI001C4B5C52|nr:aspartyl protease family protein 2-like [Zingiber officinale]
MNSVPTGSSSSFVPPSFFYMPTAWSELTHSSMASTAPPLSLLYSLLLLLLVVAGNGTSKPLQRQTLFVTPLRSPATVVPEEDEAQSLATGVDSESEGTLSPSSFHFELSHRDSLLAATASPEQVFSLRLDRDAERVESLRQMLAEVAAPLPRNVTGRRGFSSKVVSGLAQGSGEYFARIGIGTPPRYVYMVLDTGSDIVWLQCAPCRRCYSQSDPIFDPRRSHTYAAVPCGTPLCRRLDVAGCDTRRRSCQYQVSYGDGSITMGEFSTETLTFRRSVRVPRVALGCGHDNEGLFVAAAGLLGLGRGSLSFPSQAGRRFGRMFSYCLVDRTSAGAPNRSSTVVFGNSAVPRASSRVAYTPMVRNPKVDSFYYIELTGVSVGGTRVPGVLASDLRLDPSTGRGGVIIDSGTSVTRLARSAYQALRDAFRAGTTGLKLAPGGFSLFDTCYDLSGRTEVKVPTVSLHLASGSAVSLPAENYLIPVDTRGTFCFAFAGTDSGVSIIGNIQQQGYRVVFDRDRSRVGLMPRGC